MGQWDWLEDWFRGYFGRPHQYLSTANQLPDLPGDELAFTWDQYWTEGDGADPGREDEHEVRVVKCGEEEVWLELPDGVRGNDEWRRDVERLLRERYADRFAGLSRRGYGRHSVPMTMEDPPAGSE